MRLQKYIAHCGVTSRRKAEELIKKGKVRVNGKKVRKMGVKINPNKDTVQVGKRIIKLEQKNVYILLNKPTHYITSTSDEKNRKIVTDLVKDVKQRIYPVGRLDYLTSGLLILTNDGELTNKITHPSSELKKTYRVEVNQNLSNQSIEKLRKGVDIGKYITAPADVKIIDRQKKYTCLEISIHEGKNRQIRRMMSAVNSEVISLDRIMIGNISKDGLRIGNYRHLTDQEVEYLKTY